MKWQITRDKFLSKEERNQLLKATEEKAIVDLAKGRSTWIRRWMIVDLALFSGLRVFEIADLTIADLRLSGSEKLIYVQKGKGDKSGYVTIDRALAKHLREFITWKKSAGELTDAQAPLLTGSGGRPYSTRALREHFKEAVRKAGLPDHYSIHSARHTFATYLLAESRNLRLVQKQLRHSSPGVTAVYADVTPEDITAAMENLREKSNDNNSAGKKSKKADKKNHICSLCKNEITKPAKQLHIDGSEIEICPVCCEKIRPVTRKGHSLFSE
jgi:site-specific recombinase XerD